MTKLKDVTNITLEQIHLQNIDNLDKIDDIQYTSTQHRNGSFVVLSLSLCIIIGSAIIYCRYCKVQPRIYQPVVEFTKGKVMINEPKDNEPKNKELNEIQPFGESQKIFSC